MNDRPHHHTHDSIMKAGAVTITELQSDRIDLEIAIQKQIIDFHRKHPFVHISVEVRQVWDELQATITLELK